jgi:hypothetical protein
LESLDEDLDLETHSYTACRWLHELHDTVASSFDKVKAQCLSFPDKGGKVEEMIDWVVGEVKGVPDDVWWLNDKFVILGIEGVLSMLNSDLCNLVGSRDDAVLEDVPEDVHKLTGWIVQKWWKPHGLPEALRRLEEAHTETVSDCSY